MKREKTGELNKQKLLAKVVAGKSNVRFNDVCKLAEAFGFRLDRINGSHHIFVHKGLPELVNLQNVEGKAKSYQIQQLLAVVEKYDLKLEDE